MKDNESPAILVVLQSVALGVLFSCSTHHEAEAADAKTPPRVRQTFDFDWRFHLGSLPGGEAPEFDDKAWRTIDLPHDWSVELPFDPEAASGTGYLPGGTGWYRKAFHAPPEWRGREVELFFDGVYRNSEVWINGVSVGGRPYGYLPFSVRLTPHLRYGQRNVVAVRVSREEVADSRWYPGSGVYRHVWLDVTHPVCVDRWGTFVTTPRATQTRADINVATTVRNRLDQPARVRVDTRVLNPDGKRLSRQSSIVQAAAGSTGATAHWHVVEKPELWSTKSPALYTIATSVYRDGALIDETTSPFGIRTFRFHADNGFSLNEELLQIKGLCLHHDAGVVGAAVPDDVLRRRLEIVKRLGANAVRCSHNPMAEEFYDYCDSLGLLVMDEAFDEWELGKRKWVKGRNVGRAERFGSSKHFAEWGERDVADMIRRGRNHPSIILWSIGNEIDYPGDPYTHPEYFDPAAPPIEEGSPSATRLSMIAPRLIAAVKREDSTRPITMALSNTPASNSIGLAAMLDVCGYNYQEKFYDRDHAEFPGRVIYGSETGRSRAAWEAVVEKPFIAGQFLWSGFDFLGEAGRWPNRGSRSGVFDTRGFPKPSSWWRKAEWSETPFVRLLVARSIGIDTQDPRDRLRFARYPRLWQADAREPTPVLVVTNCEEVKLRLNGRQVETIEAPWASGYYSTIRYEAGELTAVGRQDGHDVTYDSLRTPGPATSVRLDCARGSLAANGRDVAAITVSVVDSSGTLVPAWDKAISIDVNGVGRLLGVDNGDQDDTTLLKSPTKIACDGRLLVLVQSLRDVGNVSVRATSPGLQPASLSLMCSDYAQYHSSASSPVVRDVVVLAAPACDKSQLSTF